MFLHGRLQTGLIFKTKKFPVLFWIYSQQAVLSPQSLMTTGLNHEKARGMGGTKRNPSSVFVRDSARRKPELVSGVVGKNCSPVHPFQEKRKTETSVPGSRPSTCSGMTTYPSARASMLIAPDFPNIGEASGTPPVLRERKTGT